MAEYDQQAQEALNRLFDKTSLVKSETGVFEGMVQKVANAIEDGSLHLVYQTADICKVAGIEL